MAPILSMRLQKTDRNGNGAGGGEVMDTQLDGFCCPDGFSKTQSQLHAGLIIHEVTAQLRLAAEQLIINLPG